MQSFYCLFGIFFYFICYGDIPCILIIYCNNNFRNEERAFPTKMAEASLNISTYISLYTYGYRNVYELGPLLDAETTKLELVASPKGAIDRARVEDGID